MDRPLEWRMYHLQTKFIGLNDNFTINVDKSDILVYNKKKSFANVINFLLIDLKICANYPTYNIFMEVGKDGRIFLDCTIIIFNCYHHYWHILVHKIL